MCVCARVHASACVGVHACECMRVSVCMCVCPRIEHNTNTIATMKATATALGMPVQ